MKRHLIRIEEIADWHCLVEAAWRAARGKRGRDSVQAFFADFTHSVNQLSEGIRSGTAPQNNYKSFVIHDPKVRTIHAACFDDRVLHHALIDSIGDVMDRRLLDTSYACRTGKGVHASALQVQRGLQRYKWFVKIDIDGYFASIPHDRLFGLLERTFKGDEGLQLLWRIIAGYECTQGCGLPIGSLTSQHFANYYLNEFDQHLFSHVGAGSHCRYMDDIIWWCDSREAARDSLALVSQWLSEKLKLAVKRHAVINRSDRGVSWCGFRVTAGQLRLSLRRQRRYTRQRLHWESRWQAGLISDHELQRQYAAINSIICGADSHGWRRANLERFPSPDL